MKTVARSTRGRGGKSDRYHRKPEFDPPAAEPRRPKPPPVRPVDRETINQAVRDFAAFKIDRATLMARITPELST